jgi:hypothetical protein
MPRPKLRRQKPMTRQPDGGIISECQAAAGTQRIGRETRNDHAFESRLIRPRVRDRVVRPIDHRDKRELERPSRLLKKEIAVDRRA